MANAAVKATAYCLAFTPEMALEHGTTPHMERVALPDSEFLKGLAASAQSYENCCSYAPNLTYVGAMSVDDLSTHPTPYIAHLLPESKRFGKYGEIMPEDEFIALMDICDVFDLIWLTKDFSVGVKARLASHPLLTEAQLKRLEEGHDTSELEEEIRNKGALPLYCGGKLVACCRRGHEMDECLSAHVLLENMASKTGAVLSLLHLINNAGMAPTDIDFVVECSEEAVGDMNQRGGGNMAKAIAEIAGCVNASGFDVRAFCAGPVSALITAASMVAAGARKNVVVISGGSVPKLYMNAREHVKKGAVPLENCMGCFAVLLTPEDGVSPVLRLDVLGKHSVGAGASPQAITTALVWDPLQTAGLAFKDIDKYAPELHITDITVPGGAGNVPEANYKMIAALAVMKGQLEKTAINDFVVTHGMPGFAHTQGHIPSGVPYMGHAVDAISTGKISRAMIIGKGSLFLGRLTNLADGASFIMEKPGLTSSSPSGGVAMDKAEVKKLILETLSDLAHGLGAKSTL